jgi:hypothetical protein
MARCPRLGRVGNYGVTHAFLVPRVIYDVHAHRRVHPATLWGGLLLVAQGTGLL